MQQNSVRLRVMKQTANTRPARLDRPWKWLRMTEHSARYVDVRNDLIALSVLRADNVDRRQQSRNHDE
jgi:hypothetical protein